MLYVGVPNRVQGKSEIGSTSRDDPLSRDDENDFFKKNEESGQSPRYQIAEVVTKLVVHVVLKNLNQ